MKPEARERENEWKSEEIVIDCELNSASLFLRYNLLVDFHIQITNFFHCRQNKKKRNFFLTINNSNGDSKRN